MNRSRVEGRAFIWRWKDNEVDRGSKSPDVHTLVHCPPWECGRPITCFPPLEYSKSDGMLFPRLCYIDSTFSVDWISSALWCWLWRNSCHKSYFCKEMNSANSDSKPGSPLFPSQSPDENSALALNLWGIHVCGRPKTVRTKALWTRLWFQLHSSLLPKSQINSWAGHVWVKPKAAQRRLGKLTQPWNHYSQC